MDDIKEIATVVSTCIGIIATISGLVIPLVKNVKAKHKLTALNKFASVLQNLISDAECFTNFTGAEKKEYVLTKANRYAIENKMDFDEEAISAKIEELVDLSKKVNAKPTGDNATDKNLNLLI